MRWMLLLCLFMLSIGCDVAEPPPPVDRIELRRSGSAALDIDVSADGQGRWRVYDPNGPEQTGQFQITPGQFDRLIERLAAYRGLAVPVTDQSIREMINGTCPGDVVLHSGGFWVRWIGPGVNEHYAADFGCDPEQHHQRNEDLRDIMRSLPVPHDII